MQIGYCFIVPLDVLCLYYIVVTCNDVADGLLVSTDHTLWVGAIFYDSMLIGYCAAMIRNSVSAFSSWILSHLWSLLYLRLRLWSS